MFNCLTSLFGVAKWITLYVHLAMILRRVPFLTQPSPPDFEPTLGKQPGRTS